MGSLAYLLVGSWNLASQNASDHIIHEYKLIYGVYHCLTMAEIESYN